MAMRPGVIESAEDLTAAIEWAGENPKARWYVARMARAFKRPELIPADWDTDEVSSFRSQQITSAEDLEKSAEVDKALDAFADTVEDLRSGKVDQAQAETLVAAIVGWADQAGVANEAMDALTAGAEVYVENQYLSRVEVDALLAAADTVRRVRTQAGVRRYKAPIGTPIVRNARTGKLEADKSRAPKPEERATAQKDAEDRYHRVNRSGTQSEREAARREVEEHRTKKVLTSVKSLKDGDEIEARDGSTFVVKRVQSDGTSTTLTVTGEDGEEKHFKIPASTRVRAVRGGNERPEKPATREEIAQRRKDDEEDIEREEGKEGLKKARGNSVSDNPHEDIKPERVRAPKAVPDRETSRGRKSYEVSYKDEDGNELTGQFWSLGPGGRSAFIIPDGERRPIQVYVDKDGTIRKGEQPKGVGARLSEKALMAKLMPNQDADTPVSDVDATERENRMERDAVKQSADRKTAQRERAARLSGHPEPKHEGPGSPETENERHLRVQGEYVQKRLADQRKALKEVEDSEGADTPEAWRRRLIIAQTEREWLETKELSGGDVDAEEIADADAKIASIKEDLARSQLSREDQANAAKVKELSGKAASLQESYQSQRTKAAGYDGTDQSAEAREARRDAANAQVEYARAELELARFRLSIAEDSGTRTIAQDSVEKWRSRLDHANSRRDKAEIELRAANETSVESPRRVGPSSEELDNQLSAAKERWKSASEAAQRYPRTDQSVEANRARLEALEAKGEVGRAIAARDADAYERKRLNTADYDRKREAWHRNNEIFQQALEEAKRRLAESEDPGLDRARRGVEQARERATKAQDALDREVARQFPGLVDGTGTDRATQNLPLSKRGMTDAEITRGAEAVRQNERAKNDLKVAESRARHLAPQQGHNPDQDRDPDKVRKSESYAKFRDSFTGTRPIDFEMDFKAAQREAKKAGDTNSAAAKAARIKLAMYTAVGEDYGMVRNGRMVRGAASRDSMELVSTEATPVPTPEPEAPETPDTPYRERRVAKLTARNEHEIAQLDQYFREALYNDETEDAALGAYMSEDVNDQTLYIHDRARALATIDDAIEGAEANLDPRLGGSTLTRDERKMYQQRKRTLQVLRRRIEESDEPAYRAPGATTPHTEWSDAEVYDVLKLSRTARQERYKELDDAELDALRTSIQNLMDTKLNGRAQWQVTERARAYRALEDMGTQRQTAERVEAARDRVANPTDGDGKPLKIIGQDGVGKHTLKKGEHYIDRDGKDQIAEGGEEIYSITDEDMVYRLGDSGYQQWAVLRQFNDGTVEVIGSQAHSDGQVRRTVRRTVDPSQLREGDATGRWRGETENERRARRSLPLKDASRRELEEGASYRITSGEHQGQTVTVDNIYGDDLDTLFVRLEDGRTVQVSPGQLRRVGVRPVSEERAAELDELAEKRGKLTRGRMTGEVAQDEFVARRDEINERQDPVEYATLSAQREEQRRQANPEPEPEIDPEDRFIPDELVNRELLQNSEPRRTDDERRVEAADALAEAGRFGRNDRSPEAQAARQRARELNQQYRQARIQPAEAPPVTRAEPESVEREVEQATADQAADAASAEEQLDRALESRTDAKGNPISQGAVYRLGRGYQEWRVVSVNRNGTLNLEPASGSSPLGNARNRKGVAANRLLPVTESPTSAPIAVTQSTASEATTDSLGELKDSAGTALSTEARYTLGRGYQRWQVDSVNADGTVNLVPTGGGDITRKRWNVAPSKLKQIEGAPAPETPSEETPKPTTQAERRERIEARAAEPVPATPARSAVPEPAPEPDRVDTATAPEPPKGMSQRVYRILIRTNENTVRDLEAKVTAGNATSDDREALERARKDLTQLREEESRFYPPSNPVEEPAPTPEPAPKRQRLTRNTEEWRDLDDETLDALIRGYAEDDRADEQDAVNLRNERAVRDQENEDLDRIIQLIEEGSDPAEAEAEVTGEPIEKIRRRAAVEWLRQTYDGVPQVTGNRFEEVLSAAYRFELEQEMIRAEAETNGQFFNREAAGRMGRRNQDATILWQGNERTARANASEELKAYWDRHGRLTKDAFRARVFQASGVKATGPAYRGSDFLQ